MRGIVATVAIIIAIVSAGCRDCAVEEPPIFCPWDAGRAEILDTGCECPDRNECEEFVYIDCDQGDGIDLRCDVEYRESGIVESSVFDFLEIVDLHYGCCADVGGEGLYFD